LEGDIVWLAKPVSGSRTTKW